MGETLIGLGVLIFVLMWIAGVVWLCWWTYTEWDGPDFIMVLGITVGAFALTLLIAGGVMQEQSNPCVAWGTPTTTFMMIDKVVTPITTTPCIRRQNEVEK